MGFGEHHIVARNSATGSENRIHSDEVARNHGFRGGLVPGVTVYGYAVPAIVGALGEDWVARGHADVRFREPCYEGDRLDIRVAGGDIEVVAGGTTCVTGHASLDRALVPADIPRHDLPERRLRPTASEETLAPGLVLGTLDLPTDSDTAVAYLAKIEEPDAVYAERRWVHPGMLLEGANWVLSANVVLPPWLHVGSEVQHLRPVGYGEPLEVRALVTAEWERRGHRFVALDLAYLVGGEVVAVAKHTALWQLRPAALNEAG